MALAVDDLHDCFRVAAVSVAARGTRAGERGAMRVLVTTATKRGAAEPIAARIGSVLGDRGHQVDLRRPAEVVTVDDYDVVVLGSAVDAGHWVKDAKELVERESADLSCRPVWLFSSGVSEALESDAISVDVADVMTVTHAYEHRVFSERDDVDRWAASIADSISSG
jgi:menaquinone-dependent protoporphyrinogen oxidase